MGCSPSLCSSNCLNFRRKLTFQYFSEISTPYANSKTNNNTEKIIIKINQPKCSEKENPGAEKEISGSEKENPGSEKENPGAEKENLGAEKENPWAEKEMWAEKKIPWAEKKIVHFYQY